MTTSGGPARPLPVQLREHAVFCADAGAPLYAALMRGMADDLEAGGPVADVLGDRPAPREADVLQLRLLGGLHRLVLTRRAPLLATFYRSVGGGAAPDDVWPVARDVVAAHVAELRAALEVPPQTNETGRAAALAVGLRVAARERGVGEVRLLEVGASAGLNLLVDRFRVTATGGGWPDWGPAGSPVDLTGTVRPAAGPVADDGADDGADDVRIVARGGCDLAPVDPRSAEGRLRLTSFVWPDHAERHRRLAGALALAAAHPVPVDRADAAPWLAARLAGPDDGVLTVVWHSVFLQYLDDAARAALQAVVDEAAARRPVARLALEAPRAPYLGAPLLTLDGVVLGTAPAHGVPVTLAGRSRSIADE